MGRGCDDEASCDRGPGSTTPEVTSSPESGWDTLARHVDGGSGGGCTRGCVPPVSGSASCRAMGYDDADCQPPASASGSATPPPPCRSHPSPEAYVHVCA